jgi:hypothetical protein
MARLPFSGLIDQTSRNILPERILAANPKSKLNMKTGMVDLVKRDSNAGNR